MEADLKPSFTPTNFNTADNFTSEHKRAAATMRSKSPAGTSIVDRSKSPRPIAATSRINKG
jgi:hypothetical protein